LGRVVSGVENVVVGVEIVLVINVFRIGKVIYIAVFGRRTTVVGVRAGLGLALGGGSAALVNYEL
jgi:hypothetical protein